MAKTVTIGCKLPNGLVLEQEGKSVHIKGNAKPLDADGNPIEGLDIVDAVGLTHNVDAEFWAAWKAKHKGFPPLEKGLLFAADGRDNAASVAKEIKDEKSGLEGIDRKKLPNKLEEVKSES